MLARSWVASAEPQSGGSRELQKLLTQDHSTDAPPRCTPGHNRGFPCGYLAVLVAVVTGTGLIFLVAVNRTPSPIAKVGSTADESVSKAEGLQIGNFSAEADNVADDHHSSRADDINAECEGDEECSGEAQANNTDFLHDKSRMDPRSVKVIVSHFKDKCLTTWGSESGKNGFEWSVWPCRRGSKAWFRENVILPPEGQEGQIKSEIAKVLGKEYCLTVPSCRGGNLLKFLPRCTPSWDNTFKLRRRADGTFRILTACNKDLCIDVPDQIMKQGNRLQAWNCSHADKKVLEDQVFSMSLAKVELEAFDKMAVTSHGGDEPCALKVFSQDLKAYAGRCGVTEGPPIVLQINQAGSTSGREVARPAHDYATLWLLWCNATGCSCTSLEPTNTSIPVERTSRTVACGVLMLKAHSPTGHCPDELAGLRKVAWQDGHLYCEAGRLAAWQLQTDEEAVHPVELRYLQVLVVGLRKRDLEAFDGFGLSNTSGDCNISNSVSSHSPGTAREEELSVTCSQEDGGSELGLKVVQENLTNEAWTLQGSVWGLWCLRDECACQAVELGEEVFWRPQRLKLGEEACGVLMLTTLSKFSECPAELAELRHTIEEPNLQGIDCAAALAGVEKLAADKAKRSLIRLKYVTIKRNEHPLTKFTKGALNFFSLFGGGVVLVSVPAWPALAKLAQFMVLLAGNRAELGLPDEFGDFAHKFTKFDSLVKSLKELGLKQKHLLPRWVRFLDPATWFSLRERLQNVTKAAVLRIFNESGAVAPELLCFLTFFYDPNRRDIVNVTAVLEVLEGANPCDLRDAQSKANETLFMNELNESEVLEDGGRVAVGIRQEWATLKKEDTQEIELLKKALTFSRKEFSVVSNLLISLVVLPVALALYTALYFCVGGIRKLFAGVGERAVNDEVNIPHAHPFFLLLYLPEIALLNTLVAWANVVLRGRHSRRLLCENPFVLLGTLITDWDMAGVGGWLLWPLWAATGLLRPFIWLFAEIPALQLTSLWSQVVANIIFVIDPIGILVFWIYHRWYVLPELPRHVEIHRHVDPECGAIKCRQELLWSWLHGLLFYEAPVAEIAGGVTVEAPQDGAVTLYGENGELQQTADDRPTSCLECREELGLEPGHRTSTGDQWISPRDRGYAVPVEVRLHGMRDKATLELDYGDGGPGAAEESTAPPSPVELRQTRGRRIIKISLQAPMDDHDPQTLRRFWEESLRRRLKDRLHQSKKFRIEDLLCAKCSCEGGKIAAVFFLYSPTGSREQVETSISQDLENLLEASRDEAVKWREWLGSQAASAGISGSGEAISFSQLAQEAALAAADRPRTAIFEFDRKAASVEDEDPGIIGHGGYKEIDSRTVRVGGPSASRRGHRSSLCCCYAPAAPGGDEDEHRPHDENRTDEHTPLKVEDSFDAIDRRYVLDVEWSSGKRELVLRGKQLGEVKWGDKVEILVPRTPRLRRVRLTWAPVEAWNAPDDPCEWVTVKLGATLSGVSSLPEAAVGRLEVILWLPGGHLLQLHVPVKAKHLPLLPEGTQLQVPFDHLALRQRDSSRALLLFDRRTQRTPHIYKLVGWAWCFLTVFFVTKLPVQGEESLLKQLRNNTDYAGNCTQTGNSTCEPILRLQVELQRRTEASEGVSGAAVILFVLLVLQTMFLVLLDGDARAAREAVPRSLTDMREAVMGVPTGALVVTLMIAVLVLSLSCVHGASLLMLVVPVCLTILLGLALGKLSPRVVEGAICRSSVLPAGQAIMVWLLLLLQLGLMDSFTGSVLLIVTMLALGGLLCHKFAAEKYREHSEGVGSFVAKVRALCEWEQDCLATQKLRLGRALWSCKHRLTVGLRDPDPGWRESFLPVPLLAIFLLVLGVAQSQLMPHGQTGGSHPRSSHGHVQPHVYATLCLMGFLHCLLIVLVCAALTWLCLWKPPKQLWQFLPVSAEAAKTLGGSFLPMPLLAISMLVFGVAQHRLMPHGRAAGNYPGSSHEDVQPQVYALLCFLGVLHSLLITLVFAAAVLCLWRLPEKLRQLSQGNAEASIGGGGAAAAAAAAAAGEPAAGGLLDRLGHRLQMSTVVIFDHTKDQVVEGTLAWESGAPLYKRLLCTEKAWSLFLSARRDLHLRTPLGETLHNLASGKTKKKEWVCTVQVIGDTDLVHGCTDVNDRILTLWRDQDVSASPTEQQKQWSEEVREFLIKHGSSGTRIDAILGSLFCGEPTPGQASPPWPLAWQRSPQEPLQAEVLHVVVAAEDLKPAASPAGAE